MEHFNAWVDGAPVQLFRLRDEEESRLQRDFKHLKERYRDMLDLSLPQSIPQWDEVENIKLIRDAVIHNQGFYTCQYARRPTARRPDENAFGVGQDPLDWVNRELIPLDLEYVHSSLDLLLNSARRVRQTVR